MHLSEDLESSYQNAPSLTPDVFRLLAAPCSTLVNGTVRTASKLATLVLVRARSFNVLAERTKWSRHRIPGFGYCITPYDTVHHDTPASIVLYQTTGVHIYVQLTSLVHDS